MASKINVEVNKTSQTFDAGTTLSEAIIKTGAPYVSGAFVCLVKKQKEEDAFFTKEYILQTTKGPLIIELKDPTSVSSKMWIEKFKSLSPLRILLETTNTVSFGPFQSRYDMEKGMKKFKKYDVLFSAGGFDTDKTTLVISKKEHYAEYGVPKDGTFATLIAGRTNLEKLTKGDVIQTIEPYVEQKNAFGEGIYTDDLTIRLEDGDRLITFADIDMSPHSPHGTETFYALVEKGTFSVDSTANAFRSDDTLQSEPCDYENFEPRKIGTISMRTAGNGRTRFYISTADRASSLLHSVVGHVTSGMELVYFSKKGTKFTVETSPPYISLLGRSVEESKNVLDAINIELTVEGYDGKDNVIVTQTPATTIEILREGKVKVAAVQRSKLIEVEFYYDAAPKSVEFFRHSIDLKTQPVGSLVASMIYDETFIFKAEKGAERYKEIMPENTPKEMVKACHLGITNQSAKRMGFIGVRLTDESMFGPTGEKFDATNIIGCILNPENLKGLLEGDRIYIKEIGAPKKTLADAEDKKIPADTEDKKISADIENENSAKENPEKSARD
ncbi:MAG: methanogenesis marker 3 protein [Methanimicrococcus sp.]|nr:methanogenesis marker 3 protein [Methanimicrococcus sp.]